MTRQEPCPHLIVQNRRAATNSIIIQLINSDLGKSELILWISSIRQQIWKYINQTNTFLQSPPFKDFLWQVKLSKVKLWYVTLFRKIYNNITSLIQPYSLLKFHGLFQFLLSPMLLIINREINLFPLNLFIKHIFQLIKYNDINSAKTESYCNKNNSFKLSSTFSSRSLSLGGIHSIQDWTATTRHGVTGKSNTKRLKHTGNLFRKSPHLIGVC